MAKKIGVLIVDDSAFMRKVLKDIMESAGDIRVLGTAGDGAAALEKVRELNPDVITLDVEMPGMDGMTCLRELQKITDAPVIIVSGLNRDGERATIEALAAGAVDLITKPTALFDIEGEEKRNEIIEKIRMTKGIRRKAGGKDAVKDETFPAGGGHEGRKSGLLKTLIAIGTSTGGPRALQEVLPYIPGNIPAAVLIVQHMPPGFTKSLADRLNTLSGLYVKEAEEGEAVKPGYSYVAPGDYHMKVVKSPEGALKIKLTREALVNGHRPAVDVMMDSIAETGFPDVVGVIMTGMGADGSKGIVNIKKANKGYIISQDEKSCVVYGMPKAAAKTGVVDEVVPLKKIAEVIVKYLGVDH